MFKNGEKQEKREAAESPEDRFLDKVQSELDLPEYNIFSELTALRVLADWQPTTPRW